MSEPESRTAPRWPAALLAGFAIALTVAALSKDSFFGLLLIGCVVIVFGALMLLCREFVQFSLRGLMLAIVTLQIPIVLLLNANRSPWFMVLGMVFATIWAVCVYVFMLDTIITRYISRERGSEAGKTDAP